MERVSISSSFVFLFLPLARGIMQLLETHPTQARDRVSLPVWPDGLNGDTC